jgi:hypothetical protein
MNFVPYFITTLFFLHDYIKKEQSLKIQFNLTFNTYLIIKIVPRIAVARCATYCLQTHPIGDLPVIDCKCEGWIGRQPWVLVFSITGCGTDIIPSLNIQQE